MTQTSSSTPKAPGCGGAAALTPRNPGLGGVTGPDPPAGHILPTPAASP